MLSKKIRWINSLLLLILFTNCSAIPPQPIETSAAAPAATSTSNSEPLVEPTPTTVYLPIVTKSTAKFFGILMKQYWGKSAVAKQMALADQAAGKKHTSVGWWTDLEDDAFTKPVTDLSINSFYVQLEELWRAGYISLVSLSSRDATAESIANGSRDTEINNAADFYKQWIALGGGRKAFIAPLQEMNGDWVSYGKDPVNFKLAYQRIVNIFIQKGITREQIWWVFSPNAWSEPGHEFEYYYPGDTLVDFVAFSSYNFAFCPATVGAYANPQWERYDRLFTPYIDRIKLMAPSKKIIIRETATTSYYALDSRSNYLKNQWLFETYSYIASQPEVIGIFYFDIGSINSQNQFVGYVCDFGITYNPDFYSGYRIALSNPTYKYLTVNDLK